MLIEQRLENYDALEAYRRRPLIVYATSTRIGINAMMAADVVREFIDQINLIEAGDEVDVLIHSTGGDALTAWKLMSLLRERFSRVCVLVPYMAFSAATIFALGADEIVMHPHASLGPIDPQIRMQDQNGVIRQFAYEDVGAFLDFIAQDVRITEQVHTSAIIERLFAVVDPVNVGAAKRASSLSTEMGERLLSMHMSQPEDQAKRRQIAENLNKKFFAHGDAVSRSRARELGLKLAEADSNLETLMWDAYCGLESHMELRRPFVPLHDYLADPNGNASMQPPAPLNLPPNFPPQAHQQVMQQVVNNALQAAAGNAYQVAFSYLIAVCESTRGASEVRSVGRMWATALATADIKLGMIEEGNGWKPVTIGRKPKPRPGENPKAPRKRKKV